MPEKNMMQQALDANKAAFDSAFRAMVALQEQAETMTSALLAQATWVPEEGRKAMREWAEACRKGREDYKRLVDDGFERVRSSLEGGGK